MLGKMAKRIGCMMLGHDWNYYYDKCEHLAKVCDDCGKKKR